MQITRKTPQIAGRLALTLMLIGGLLLTACNGRALIDVNLDDEGSGTISITGSGESSTDGGSAEGDTSGGESNTALSQPVLLFLIIGGFLLILVLIITMSQNRTQTVIHEESPPRDRKSE